MNLISHRGNITGPDKNKENSPAYIDAAIDLGYDVEIDLWYCDGSFILGHDRPQYKINYEWLMNRKSKIWIHCKNTEAISMMNENTEFNYFWHENDTVTLTSKGYIWAYPGKQPIKNSIAVMPEIYNDTLSDCIGICSDFVGNY